ncbi:LysR substrate-binding domain-containing protein [Halomonas piscis]|uniref:LysR substrate-binding domain-containing protein n=1 Tax=Halomonas piscis TaxID=3031727 RepID=A0ABY9YZM7_9GAMM|nr:LysR substrate-binding domain-containing protein [Halomonas piscis]WNK19910.1 LysR substrate-binding domain-containing protein [Halomonas piscis]
MTSPDTNQHIPPLNWLQAFEAAARLESFTLASTELSRTQATISQQIRNLELHLATELFQRLPRGVELTLDGAAYLPHVRSAFQTIAASTRDLFAHDQSQSVSLSSPVSFVAAWIAPLLPELRRLDDRINLSIVSIQRPVDYTVEDADLEIRYGNGPWPGTEATLLLEDVLVPVCAPALANSTGDWRNLPVIALAGARAGWSDWCAHAGIAPLSNPVLRFDSFILALEAAKAGGGLLLAPLSLIRATLREGELVRLSDIELRTESGHWLLRDTQKPSTQAIDKIRAWLINKARASR